MFLRKRFSHLLHQRRAFIASTRRISPSSTHYDLVIIGSGPAAQKCAIESAKLGRRVAVVDKLGMMGGVCVHTGTIPSKTFREAVLHLTGYRHQGFYGRAYQPWRERISIPDILMLVKKVEKAETDVIVDQMRCEGIEVITGTAKFADPHEIGAFTSPDIDKSTIQLIVLKTNQNHESTTSAYRHLAADTAKMALSADNVMISCGTRPLRPDHVPFDGKVIFDSDQLLWGRVSDVPRDLIVVGAGVIGMEYASMINIIPGTHVTVIDPRSNILGFADTEVVQALMYSMRTRGARFMLEEKVEKIEKIEDATGAGGKTRVIAYLQSGKRVIGDALLYTMGRQGNTDSLNSNAVGITPDSRGLIEVNDFYQTSNPHIYACGDVIGYPALASTSMEQGRRAALHMWHGQETAEEVLKASDQAALVEGENAGHEKVRAAMREGFLGRTSEHLFPYGIYTIPEVSMIGKPEAQLTKEGIPYEIGMADFTELAKGQMLGGADGFLKLIFHRESMKLLGVHAIGEGATEIIHIGQVVMSMGGTLDYFRHAVFNYPTLAEAYNVAAQNAFRKISL